MGMNITVLRTYGCHLQIYFYIYFAALLLQKRLNIYTIPKRLNINMYGKD